MPVPIRLHPRDDAPDLGMDARSCNGRLVWVTRDVGEDRRSTISRAWFLAKELAAAPPSAQTPRPGVPSEARALARCAAAHAQLGCAYDDAVMCALQDRA